MKATGELMARYQQLNAMTLEERFNAIKS